MTTPTTPVYGFPYVAEGESMYLWRERNEATLQLLESVLLTKDVAAPGAADLATLAARVTALENKAVAGASVTTVPVVAATGWAVNSSKLRKIGYGMAAMLVTFSRTGANITGVPSNGNIANQDVFTLPTAWRPLHTVAVTTAATGRIAAGYLAGDDLAPGITSGLCRMTAVTVDTASTSIVTGESFDFLAVYPLATP